MPDGLLSNTSLKTRLYSATALPSPASRSTASVTGAPTAQSVDRLLDLGQGGRIDRKFAQAARQERGNAARIAGHFTAQADAYSGAFAVLHRSTNELEHRRLERIDQFAERSVGPIARRDILSQIVGANGKECCHEPLDRQGCRRHFDHDAKFGKRRGNTFGLQLVNDIREYLASSLQFVRRRHHGKHDLEVSVHGGAAQRAKLNGKDVRPRQAKTQTANAKERVRLTVLGKSGHRLVAACVEGPD